MKYSETLDYLFSRLPMYQRIGPAAYKNNLDNTIRLDEFYGNPHRRFKSVHVAGTNGKGSVSHILASIFQMAGYKTGLYTSPHLKDFRERIKIDGKMILRQEVTRWVEKFIINNENWNLEPSFFELTVAMAFDYFARKSVDIAVIEVGLGGRLDSTNIIKPEVSLITNIGWDHASLLGNSLEKIAYEKAGIIKQGIPVVVGTHQPDLLNIFLSESAKKMTSLSIADHDYIVTGAMIDMEGNQLISVEKKSDNQYFQLKLDLKGIYQQKNIPAVLKAIDVLRGRGWNITDKNIRDGLSQVTLLTGLQGRWQVLGNDPLIICDTAHNADGFQEVVKQIKQTSFKKLHIIFGMVNDKDPLKIMEMLPKDADYYFTRANIPRAMDEKALARFAGRFGLAGKTYTGVKAAYRSAVSNAGKNDMIFIGGSTFVVAEILSG